MGKPVIIVSSITYAIKSRDLLLENGIRARIERISDRNSAFGCGYSIYVPEQTDEAEQILRNAGIKIRARLERDDLL